MRYMGDHPSKENRDSNELTDLIFDPPLKDVSKLVIFKKKIFLVVWILFGVFFLLLTLELLLECLLK